MLMLSYLRKAPHHLTMLEVEPEGDPPPKAAQAMTTVDGQGREEDAGGQDAATRRST